MGPKRQRDRSKEGTADDDVKLVYQISGQDIASFKQNQWQATNYALVLYAALIALFRGQAVSLCGRMLLCGVILVVAVAALYFVYVLQVSIGSARKRVKGAQVRLSTEANDVLDQGGRTRREVVWLFYAAVVIGAIISAVVIWNLPAG